MAIQSGIVLSDNGDGTVNVQMGPAGYIIVVAAPFYLDEAISFVAGAEYALADGDTQGL